MPIRYEVINSKLKLNHPLYLHTYKVLSISAPISLIYERGIYEPHIEIVYDVELDDGRSVRMKEEFANEIKLGDEIHYNVVIDDFIKFTPENYDVTLQLVV